MKQGDKFINKYGIVIEVIEEADKLGQVLCKIRTTYCCTSEESLIACLKANSYKKLK